MQSLKLDFLIFDVLVRCFVCVTSLISALTSMDDRKVVDLWSKGQIITFQVFVGDTPFTSC